MKILIADDDPVSRRLLEVRLRAWGYEVVSARDGTEAWEILRQEGSPRLAVLDWMMPGLDGPELCRRIRAQGQEPYIYVLLLTAKQRREDVVAGLDAGADDYVAKPFDLPELEVRLRAAARVVSLQTELVATRESLRFEATHDRLTELLNRGAVYQALEREAQRAVAGLQPLAVAMIDLDFFKLVNDTYGHPAGDAVLRAAAHRAASALRGHDVVGRYGGEEFLVVLPGCGAAEAAAVGERIRAAIASQPVHVDRGSIEVTASIGVATMARDADVDRIIAAADAALYCAKRGGRNRVEIGLVSAEVTEKLRRAPSRPAPPIAAIAGALAR